MFGLLKRGGKVYAALIIPKLLSNTRKNTVKAINDCAGMGSVLSLLSLGFMDKIEDESMANLVVRNLDQRIVHALKQRAARHGRSAEAEHRALLEASLLKPTGKSFAEALKSMPDVGQDADFERAEEQNVNKHVFD